MSVTTFETKVGGVFNTFQNLAHSVDVESEWFIYFKFVLREFQPMTFASDDSFLSLDKDTN